MQAAGDQLSLKSRFDFSVMSLYPLAAMLPLPRQQGKVNRHGIRKKDAPRPPLACIFSPSVRRVSRLLSPASPPVAVPAELAAQSTPAFFQPPHQPEPGSLLSQTSYQFKELEREEGKTHQASEAGGKEG